MPDTLTYKSVAECIGNQCISVQCSVPYVPIGYTKAIASCSFNSCSGNLSGNIFVRNTNNTSTANPSSSYTWNNLQEGEYLLCQYTVANWNSLNVNVGSLACTITLYK